MRWLILLLLLPLLEINVFIHVGAEIGVFWVIVLTLVTAVGGLALVRIQGFDTYRRLQQLMARGENPAQEMIAGMLLLVAGLLLFLPGLVSDSVGALLLVPPLRNYLAGRMSHSGGGSWLFVRRTQWHDVEDNPAEPSSDGKPRQRAGRTIDHDDL